MGQERTFTGDLAAVDPLSPEAIEAAERVMHDGRLFRYSETANGLPEAALLEEDFAAWQGCRYGIAVSSGGAALFLALKALGVAPGDPVLLNAFTLAPVPGAIAHANAQPVLVEICEDLTVDLDDLRLKAVASGARVMIASHMRGYFGDMGALAALCEDLGVALIEDCAHAFGATWQGKRAGSFGQIGCFSAQSYKHLNGGEGGLIATEDADLAAKIILMSGSYMLYHQHRARPDADVFERWKYTCPNFSMRLSGLTAALLRPQLGEVDARIATWRRTHARIAARLKTSNAITVPRPPEGAQLTPTSLQFLFTDPSPEAAEAALGRMAARGVQIKWFGAPDPVGFTSRPDHWRYVQGAPDLPRSQDILARLCDLRLPLSLSDADADLISDIILESL